MLEYSKMETISAKPCSQMNTFAATYDFFYKKPPTDGVMALAENFRFDKNATIAFDWSNASMG